MDGSKRSSIVGELSEALDISGLREIHQARGNLAKSVWIFIFIINIAVTSYYVYSVVKEFMGDTTVTKFSFDRRPYVAYPPMALCSRHWLNVTRAYEIGLTEEGVKAVLRYFGEAYDLKNLTAAEENWRRVAAENGHGGVMELSKALLIDVNETLGCLNCIHSEAVAMFSESYLCHRIDLRAENTASRVAGDAFSDIEMKLGNQSNHILGLNFVMLNIHESWVSPIALGGVYLEIGRRHFIHLKPSIFKRGSWHNCIDKATAVASNYSQLRCSSFCMQLNYYYPCYNCVELGYAEEVAGQFFHICSSKDLRSNCRPEEVRYCTKLESDNDCSRSLTEVAADCMAQCQDVCESISYDITMSSRVDERPEMSTGLSVAIILDIMGGVAVYEEINVYSVESLIANLGGVVGLCLGGTLMTFVQLFSFSVSRCMTRFRQAPSWSEKAEVEEVPQRPACNCSKEIAELREKQNSFQADMDKLMSMSNRQE